MKGRLAGLDGLRGFALFLVLWFHFRASEMPGGWIGICLFFPLSGFLITRLIINELSSTSTLSLRRFWSRRARRLMPGLFTMLAIMPLVAVFAGFSPSDMWGVVWSTLLYANNWWQLSQHSDYWTKFAGEVSPFEHLWSLSVEEQFYVAWPLVVLGVWKVARRPRRALLTLCAVAGTAGVALGIAHAVRGAEVTAVYFDTLVRSAEILAGAALAVVVDARPDWLRRPRVAALADVLGWVGLLGVLVIAIVLEDSSGFINYGGMFVAAIAGCATVAGCLTRRSLATVLDWSVLRWLGTRSYGLYLWHWPIYVLVTKEAVGLSGWWLTAVHASLTTACTVFSYWVIEDRWKARPIHPVSVPIPVEAALAA